jgi:hypothetical protein
MKMDPLRRKNDRSINDNLNLCKEEAKRDGVDNDSDDTVTPDPFSHCSTNVRSKHNHDDRHSLPVESVLVDAVSSAPSITRSSADHLLESSLSSDDSEVTASMSNDLEPTPINPSGKLHVVKQFDLALHGSLQSSSLSDIFFSNLSKIFPAPNHSTRDAFVRKANSLPSPLQAKVGLTQLQSTVSTPSSMCTLEGRSVADRWNDRYQQFKEFIQKHGHCHVPINYKENPHLSRWAKRQRYQWKLKQEGKPSAMTDSRYALLEDLGFLWDVRHTTWDSRYRELLQFHAIHGHCHVSINCNEFPKLVSLYKHERCIST